MVAGLVACSSEIAQRNRRNGHCGRGSRFFFFSSRRRHTRFDCDWSSDVCSSDLLTEPSDARILAEIMFFTLTPPLVVGGDRKSTRLNSSHSQISYAVFCLKKKKASEMIL